MPAACSSACAAAPMPHLPVLQSLLQTREQELKKAQSKVQALHNQLGSYLSVGSSRASSRGVTREVLPEVGGGSRARLAVVVLGQPVAWQQTCNEQRVSG